MMVMSGGFQAFAGLVALFENEFYVATRDYLFQFDATAWGWIHLLGGLLIAAGGSRGDGGPDLGPGGRNHRGGAERASQLRFIPYYPFWALTIIALDVFVIWALAAHGRDVTA